MFPKLTEALEQILAVFCDLVQGQSCCHQKQLSARFVSATMGQDSFGQENRLEHARKWALKLGVVLVKKALKLNG